jgi:hypothetical protein
MVCFTIAPNASRIKDCGLDGYIVRQRMIGDGALSVGANHAINRQLERAAAAGAAH